MGDVFGAKKAAKIQAAAITDSANLQAQNDRWAAEASTQSAELSIAQDAAARTAAEAQSIPTEAVDVSLDPNVDNATLDAAGRRITKRNAYTAPSGIGL